MNNLQLVQEAAMPYIAAESSNIRLDFGTFRCVVFQATGGWFVGIFGDPLMYHFETMGEALDFACDEARLA